MTPTHLLRDTTLKNTLTEMMSLTNETGLETGVVIKTHNNRLYTTPIQTGLGGSITLQFGNGTPVATAHTHPTDQYESLFSATDIQSYLNGPMQFAYLVYDDGDVAKADIYQTDQYETYQDLLSETDGNGTLAIKQMNEKLHRGTEVLDQW